ncbi:MAG: 5-formyltetrahydrofolate cyclo-ligase [Pseudomonadota bacterium]|nr:5-formyltetrahydrofolate cyclo-ligase [Pseudomonadota bacterium]
MTPLAEAKAEARRAAFARRRAAHAALGAAPGAATRALADAVREAAPAGPVAVYLPIRTEIDPRPAMALLAGEGVALCVPVVQGAGLPLRFLAWTPATPLVAGAFGAQVPEGEAWVRPALVVAPLVAFDAGRMRLGYGGGFYDRTLEELGPVPAIGFAFAAQRSDAPLPREATDRPLSAVVTEAGRF